MSDVTRILSRIEAGDPAASKQLLPLVYDELKKLAACRMAQEKPGQTLQATALVHEAYLRLVENRDTKPPGSSPQWDSRGHFFGAAAEAMRRSHHAPRDEAQRAERDLSADWSFPGIAAECLSAKRTGRWRDVGDK